MRTILGIALILVGLTAGVQAQTNSSPAQTNNVTDERWTRIILDEDFKGVWANAEIAYQVAVASGMLGPGGNEDMLGFEDMMKYFSNPPLTVEALTKKYGKPRRIVTDDGKKWLDYGPIQFAQSNDGVSVTTFRAPRGFFRNGFLKVVENTIKSHEKAKTETK